MSVEELGLDNSTVAVVVGAANGGIGFGIAKACLERYEMDLCVADLDQTALDATIEKLQSLNVVKAKNLKVIGVQLDISKQGDCLMLVEKVKDLFDKPVGLVSNNAAIHTGQTSFLKSTWKDWMFTYQVNGQTGVRSYLCCTSSLASLTMGTGEPYLSSKVAVTSMMESLSKEIIAHVSNVDGRVTAHVLLPGVCKSNLAVSSLKARPKHFRLSKQEKLKLREESNLSKKPETQSFEDPIVFREMMKLGMTTDECAQKFFDQLEQNKFYIIADNDHPIDINGIMMARVDEVTVAKTHPKPPPPPPIVLEAVKRARLNTKGSSKL